MTDTYCFSGHYTDRDDDPYYYTNWDRGGPISVLASTRVEAAKKVWALLGPAPGGRHWVLRWDSISEARGGDDD